VIGEAQLQKHSSLLPVGQPEKPDKAQNAMPGAWQQWPMAYPRSSPPQQQGRQHHAPTSCSCLRILTSFFK